MANDYFNNVRTLTPGTVANGNEVDDKFDSVSAGFDLLDGEMDGVVRIDNLDFPGGVIAFDAVARAGNVIGFNQDGELSLVAPGFTWRDEWATGTFYRVNDVIVDSTGALGLHNLYICTVEHTSADLAAEATNWKLLVNVDEVNTAASDAEAARDTTINMRDEVLSATTSFYAEYLGSYTTGPAVDPNGDPVTVGAMYWDSTASQMRVWDGTSWVEALADPTVLEVLANVNLALAANKAYRIIGTTPLTLTLPAAPVAGTAIRLIDGESISPDVAHTVARNGNTIMGVADDLTLDVVGINVTLWYDGSDWRLF